MESFEEFSSSSDKKKVPLDTNKINTRNDFIGPKHEDIVFEAEEKEIDYLKTLSKKMI